MFKLYLSPSNQEGNKGVGGFGTEEIYCNVVADKIQSMLKDYDIRIFRNKPDMALETIVSHSNVEHVNLHVAIHTNANDGKSQGCEVFCHKFGGQGEHAARLIYSKIAAITPGIDRGVKQGYNYYGEGKHMYELAYTSAPACLVEIDFHDNMSSAMWLLQNTDLIARNIAYAILEYFNITIKNPEPVKMIVRAEVISMLNQVISKLQG